MRLDEERPELFEAAEKPPDMDFFDPYGEGSESLLRLLDPVGVCLVVHCTCSCCTCIRSDDKIEKVQQSCHGLLFFSFLGIPLFNLLGIDSRDLLIQLSIEPQYSQYIQPGMEAAAIPFQHLHIQQMQQACLKGEQDREHEEFETEE